jgi:hypothetical protein
VPVKAQGIELCRGLCQVEASLDGYVEVSGDLTQLFGRRFHGGDVARRYASDAGVLSSSSGV